MNFKSLMKGPIEEIFTIGGTEHKLTGYSRANIKAKKEKLRKEHEQDMLSRRLSKINGKTIDWNAFTPSISDWRHIPVSVPVKNRPYDVMDGCDCSNDLEIYPPKTPSNPADRTPSEWLNGSYYIKYFRARHPSAGKYACLDMDGGLYICEETLKMDRSGSLVFDGEILAIKAEEFPPPKSGDPIAWVSLGDISLITKRKFGGSNNDQK